MKTESPSAILLVSKRSEALTSFQGPLLSYPVVVSIDREKSVLRRWIVFSQGKRSVLPRYLIGKLLWDELNNFEKKILYSLPEITNDLTMFLSLKALNLGISKREIRERLIHSPFPELWSITRQQYLSIKGRVRFFFMFEEISLRKTMKFSGYTKHHKDHGSLGPEKEFYLPELLDPYENVSEEILFLYLSVGKISLLGREVFYPDEDQQVRNGPKSNS